MFKAEAKVQAALAFGGPLKPLERQESKRKTDEASKNEGHREGKTKSTDAKSDLACRGTKLKRKANGLHDEGPGGTTPQKQTVKKRSIAAVQPQLAQRESFKPHPTKKLTGSGQVVKATFNPVFARSKHKACPAVDSIDLTTPSKTASIPLTIRKLNCPISSALPPVHILQGGDSHAAVKSCEAARGHKISYQRGRPDQQRHRDTTASVCLGTILRQEDNFEVTLTNKHEGVDAWIAKKRCQMLSNRRQGGGEWVPDGLHLQTRRPEEQNTPPPMSYLNDVMQSLQHGHQCDQSPSDDHLWVERLTGLQEQSRRAAHDHLPWVHKYAPVVADRVLENSVASKEVLAWLKQVEPIEAALTSMRSGHMTDSNAISSWKADSDDSDFDQGHGTRQFTGVGGMIISGPHGCGKSAAVYACAQELGIQVLEINPGMDRTGAMLLRLIGEATQSHRVQWGSGGHTDEVATGEMHNAKRSSKQAPKQKPVSKGHKRAANGSARPAADQPVLPGASAIQPVHAEDQQPVGQLAQRSLLLFEDFDQLLDRDEGFLASVAALLNKSKIAVVLLSERPDAEAVLRGTATCASIKSVQMRAPSHASVIEYLALVCAAEKHYVHPAMLHRLALSCNGDLRSALLQLQFIACQKPPHANGDDFLQNSMLATMPRSLSCIHAPAAGEPSLRPACMVDGVTMALRDHAWACASLQQINAPHAMASPSPEGSSCCPAVVASGEVRHSSECKGSELVPGTQIEAGVAHEQSFPEENSDAVMPWQRCGHDGEAAGPKAPPWMSAMQERRDHAAAAVLDAWAEVLKQRQCPKRAKRRGPQFSQSPSGGRPVATNSPEEGNGQPAPVVSTDQIVQQAKDVCNLEDDVPMGGNGTTRGSPSACAAEADPIPQLGSCSSAPSCRSGSTREVLARPCRAVLDDSDDAEGEGGAAACTVSPFHAVSPCPQASVHGDEAAVTAAVVAEMVARCQDVEAVCSNPRACSVQEPAHHGAAEGGCGAACAPQDVCRGDAVWVGGGPVQVPSDGGSAAGLSIAAAAAAAGMLAAAAACGPVCRGTVAPVTAQTPAEVAPLTPCAPAESAASKPKCGGKRAQKGSDGGGAAPKRRGRPRKNTTQAAAADAASRAAVVLQQGRETMSRRIEHVQRQAAELRSSCGAVAPVGDEAPVPSGATGAGMCNADVPQDSQLEWACRVSEVLSASDVYAWHVAGSCSTGVSGMAGEWLWMGDDFDDEVAPVSDAQRASGLCLRTEEMLVLEQAEQAISGACGALLGCCGTSVPGDGVKLLRQDRSMERRVEMVDRVRFGMRECSRQSLFESWHALGGMAHDECALTAAQCADGAVPRRTRRKRGHCAEAVCVWDIEISEIETAALAWSPTV